MSMQPPAVQEERAAAELRCVASDDAVKAGSDSDVSRDQGWVQRDSIITDLSNVRIMCPENSLQAPHMTISVSRTSLSVIMERSHR